MWNAPPSAASEDAAPAPDASQSPKRGLRLPRLRLPSVSLPRLRLRRPPAPSDAQPRPQPKRKSPPRLSLPRIQRPSLKLPRLRLPPLRLPTISRPQLKMPHPPRVLSLTLPRLPRPKRLKPSLPADAAPSRWPAIGRFISRVTSGDFWALTREDKDGKGHDYTRFAALLGLFSVVALATLVVVVIAALVSGDDSPSLGPPFDSPSPSTSSTLTPPPTAPGSLSDAPWIDAQLLQDDPLAAADILWATALATGAPDLVAAANHIRQAVAIERPINEDYLCPILDRYNADYSSGPAGSPACGGAIVEPPPDDDIALGIWANELSAWIFGDLPADAASYSEGDEAPFLLTWDAEPGEEYTIEITYTCSADGVPAIDILSGVQFADPAIFDAERGPGDQVPDAAVPLPDTPDLAIDDGSVRLLYLYGGNFLLLPQGPDPAEGCDDERTITVPVRANSDAEEMILMGSVRFADAADHDGQGAADADSISLSVSVSAVGAATAELAPGVIAR